MDAYPKRKTRVNSKAYSLTLGRNSRKQQASVFRSGKGCQNVSRSLKDEAFWKLYLLRQERGSKIPGLRISIFEYRYTEILKLFSVIFLNTEILKFKPSQFQYYIEIPKFKQSQFRYYTQIPKFKPSHFSIIPK